MACHIVLAYGPMDLTIPNSGLDTMLTQGLHVKETKGLTWRKGVFEWTAERQVDGEN